MIDPKELRIGSHVSANGVRAKVIDIHNKLLRPDYKYQIFVEGISPEDGEKKVVGSIVDYLEPIPLTPELLRDLGFHEVKDTYFSDWHIGWFKITNNTGQAKPWWTYNGSIRLYYLHQLENLYYMMNKEELIKE